MKKQLLSLILAISSISFGASTAQISASVNLITPIEIRTSADLTTKSITTSTLGLVQFPEIELVTFGSAGTSFILETNQIIELKDMKTNNIVPVNVSFKDGSVTTNGSIAQAIQIISSNGSTKNALTLSTNLSTTLSAGSYTGTATITAQYN